jgi:Ca-activated chloride channel family protein
LSFFSAIIQEKESDAEVRFLEAGTEPDQFNLKQTLDAYSALASRPGGREFAIRELARVLRLRTPAHRTEAYDPIVENDFLSPTTAPLSTFSLDVDTASYANVRRFLGADQIPPRHAVRIEEMINYFRYDDPAPEENGEHPVAITTEVARCFWNLNHKIVRIGVKAKDISFENRLASNFVFLVDVSGSMDSPEKLPLLKKSFHLLVDTLGENDRVAIVVYASATGLALPSTTGDRKEVILEAIESLSPGGSTNGAGGIQLAYQTAVENLIPGGNNRVILATDGDFNVGITDRGALVDLIEDTARSGVFLSVLGFGQGNLKDATMEQLADKGNGNYSYIDSLDEAQKVLVREMGGTLYTVAKDVKLQAEFNPARVAAYRLIGYENRKLADRDFNDDTKDAGDLGAGHSICALYEIVPAGEPVEPGVDPLRYQTGRGLTDAALASELLTVKLRYKEPTSSKSVLLLASLSDGDGSFDAASADLRWSAAVASFGLLLRGSAYKGTASFPAILEVCAGALGQDSHGDRAGFVTLVTKAAHLLSQ